MSALLNKNKRNVCLALLFILQIVGLWPQVQCVSGKWKTNDRHLELPNAPSKLCFQDLSYLFSLKRYFCSNNIYIVVVWVFLQHDGA